MRSKQCEYGNCHRHTSYFMNWAEDGQRWSGYVCATHDRYWGRLHLAEALGLSMAEAVGLDMAMRKENKP